MGLIKVPFGVKKEKFDEMIKYLKLVSECSPKSQYDLLNVDVKKWIVRANKKQLVEFLAYVAYDLEFDFVTLNRLLSLMNFIVNRYNIKKLFPEPVGEYKWFMKDTN